MDKAKTGAIAIAAGALIVGGSAFIATHQTLDSKPGYQVEAQGDGHYDVYTLKDGKKVIMGKDLTSEQADNFLNTKLGRHNP